MWLDGGAKLVLLVLATCAVTQAQDLGYTLVQQRADTVITNISCDQNSGFFSVVIFNGYVGEKVFYVSGQTDGVGDPLFPNPLQLSILPRSYGTLYLYGPTNVGAGSRTIVGARSFIDAWIVNYDDTVPARIFQTVSTVCGNATGPCNCGFFAAGCQLSGGCGPENYFLFWSFIYIGIVFVMFVLGFIFEEWTPWLTHRSKAAEAYTNIRDQTQNGVDAQVSEYRNQLKYNQTNESQLYAELQNVESRLDSMPKARDEASYGEALHLGGYSNAAYDNTGEDTGVSCRDKKR